MSQEFDPYHRWLGIPPEEQPANHYRLLGLVQLESDVEVIRDAAERQIAHVRRYGLGKHSDLSQRILNELARAKACLQDPEKKSEYDAQLRRKLSASKSQGAPGPAVDAPLAPKATEAPPLRPSKPPDLPGTASAVKPERARVPAVGGNAAKWIVIGGGAAAGAFLVVSLAIYFAWGRTGGGEGKVPPAPEAQAPGPSQVAAGTPAVQARPRPPKLATISDQTVEEGQPLVVKAELADRGTAPGALLFKFSQPPPLGAMIDVDTGVFRWTPSREHAGVKHAVTVQVAVQDASELADSVTFRVNVQSLLPPRLEEMPELKVEAGGRRRYNVKASDPNRTPRNLEYSLRDSPPWVRIDRASGTVTLEPPEDDRGGEYRMLVRVTSDAPNASPVEKSLAVVVTARPQPSAEAGRKMPESADLSGLAEIKGLSGSFDPSKMDARKMALAAAQNLMDRAGSDSQVMPLFSGAFGGPVAAVCELNKGSKLDGAVITFHPGKDPLTCMSNRMREILANAPAVTPRRSVSGMPGFGATPRPPDGNDAASAPAGAGAPNVMMSPSPVQMVSARERAAQACWADVGLEGYGEFKQGDRHGVVAAWDSNGQRIYWGNYQRGKPHDFCCLFQNDRPRIVVVFDQGEKGAVYLISNNRVQKSFASAEDAQNDATAQSLLKELDDRESQFRQGERELEKQIKKTIQFRLGNLRQYKTLMAQMRMSGRATKQIQGIQDSQRRATEAR